MNPLGLITGGAVEGILGGVDKIAGRFTVNKDLKEANVHGEQMAVSDGMAAEYQYRGERTWFDALIDGINRLPRPLIALGVLSIIPWCVIDPVGFAEAMQALALVPEFLATIILAVVGLYFGTRTIEKIAPSFGGPSKARVQEILDNIKEIRALRAPEDTRMDDAAYQAAMRDKETPLSNDAIAEWNRRRRA